MHGAHTRTEELYRHNIIIVTDANQIESDRIESSRLNQHSSPCMLLCHTASKHTTQHVRAQILTKKISKQQCSIPFVNSLIEPELELGLWHSAL